MYSSPYLIFRDGELKTECARVRAIHKFFGFFFSQQRACSLTDRKKVNYLFGAHTIMAMVCCHTYTYIRIHYTSEAHHAHNSMQYHSQKMKLSSLRRRKEEHARSKGGRGMTETTAPTLKLTRTYRQLWALCSHSHDTIHIKTNISMSFSSAHFIFGIHPYGHTYTRRLHAKFQAHKPFPSSSSSFSDRANTSKNWIFSRCGSRRRRHRSRRQRSRLSFSPHYA